MAALLVVLFLAPAPQAAAETQTRYTVAFAGIEKTPLETALRDNALLVSLQDRPPSSLAALKRRAAEDEERFRSILRASSYYDASIDTEFSADDPVAVTVHVTPGPAYLLAAFIVDPKGCDGRDCAPTPSEADLDIALGKPATSAEIRDAERRARTWYRQRGHPSPESAPLDIVVDHKLLGVFVTQAVTPGPRAQLGNVDITGAPGVSKDYLRRLATWTPGDLYDVRVIDSYRKRLEDTALFDTVSLTPRLPPVDGTVPVDVELTERAARSIGAGVSYSTSEGPGVTTFWEHRNILGADEDLHVEGTATAIRQSLAANFTKPAFIRTDQDLLASSELAHKTTDAYDSDSFTSQIGVERRITPALRGGLSLLFEASQITDAEGTNNAYVFGTPVVLTWDKRDSPLDAHRGHIVSGEVIPFAGVNGKPIQFSHFETSAAKYLQVLKDPDVVFAVRGRLGSLIGAQTDDIPATRRFYAGGGGSIRGYEFERVGPLDAENDPLGGRSVVEFGAELRFRTVWDIGVVPFVDAGNVYDDSFPTFDDPLQWAAGLGFRYYTPIGPLRLDFAVPINRRPNVDDSFQFYISLGQAF